MQLIYRLIERLKQLLLLPLQVLKLLQPHLVLPLDLLEHRVALHYAALSLPERPHYQVVLLALLTQHLDLLARLL